MPPIQTLFLPNSRGGLIVSTPNQTVFAGGIPVATSLSLVSPHHDCQNNPIHCAALTTGLGGATARVLVQGLPVSVTGDPDTCGHTRLVGFPTVIVG